MPSPTVRRTWPLGITLLLTLSVAAVASPALAQPRGNDVASLTARLERQNHEADQVVEAYLQKKLALEQTRRELNGLRARVQEAETRHKELQAQVNALGVGAYQLGPTHGMMAVFSADPANALRGIETLDLLAQRNEELMAQYQAVNSALGAMIAELRGTEKRQAAELAAMAKEKAKVERAVAATQRLLREARARNALANRTVDQEYGPRPTSAGPIPPVSGNAGAAIAWAASQIGKPYCYGGAGPSCFDCSGLVMMAWRAGGKSLPHSSGAMRGSLPAVSNPQPGDIVWWPGHVGLYIGGGRMIAATHTGDFVRNQPVRAGATYLRP